MDEIQPFYDLLTINSQFLSFRWTRLLISTDHMWPPGHSLPKIGLEEPLCIFTAKAHAITWLDGKSHLVHSTCWPAPPCRSPRPRRSSCRSRWAERDLREETARDWRLGLILWNAVVCNPARPKKKTKLTSQVCSLSVCVFFFCHSATNPRLEPFSEAHQFSVITPV